MSIITTETYGAYPNGAPAGHTHTGSGASSVSSGELLTTGLTTGQRGGATLDVSAGALILRVEARTQLVSVIAGGKPAGGLFLKYTSGSGALGFLGFRVTCTYTKAAIAANSFVTVTVEGSRTSASFSTFTNFLTNGDLVANSSVLVIEARYTASTDTIEYRGYKVGGTVHSFVSFGVHTDFRTIGGPGGVADWADAGGSNTQWQSLVTEVTGPAAPTVTISSIGHFGASLTGSAFSDPNPSGTHAQSQFRVRDTSDDSILYGPATVASAFLGPHVATGLPADTSGIVGEVRYKDQYGLWGDWGTSSPFATLAPPAAPAVVVDQIRRTTARLAGGTYDSGGSGSPHAATEYRVRRVSDDAVLFPATAASASTLVGPWYVTGLPDGPAGAGGRPSTDPDYVGEIRYQDGDGLWSAWGTSAAFQTLNLWESGEFVVHVDLFIERPEGAGTVMQSYADFGGKYWIKSWQINPASVDTPIGSATFTLFRQIDGVSIATLMTGSVLNQDGGDFAPALDFGREVEARICIMPKGEEPDAADWLAGFHWRGLTDDIDWPRKTGDITVPCRDYSGRLYDTMMRSEARYGDPDMPVDAFDVMQDYVDAHMGAGQYVLDDLTTGDRFLVKSWIPKDVKVWEGLQQVALQWGGKSIRQVDGPTESKVSIIEPDRTATTADYEVAPRVYLEVNAISTDGANLRTIVRGRCVDAATGEILTSQLPAEEDVDTDPLVDLYGPLFLQFDEDQASAIDTQAELDAMVAAAYADVSTPPFPVEVETKFAGFASIDQMVGWGANGLLWDETLVSAVISLSHSGDAPGVGRTRWRGAGAQKGHWREWTRRGVDVAGIGKRPSIFSLTLTHDPVGTLNAEVDYNEQVERFRAWDKVGASPVTAGVPDDTYGQGEYPRPVRVASWSVTNGVHYVHVRAYAADRWVSASDTIAIVGVGPGSGEIPIDTPRTPFLARGTVDGGDQSVLASWLNTNTVDAIELKYFIDGVEDPGGLVSLAAGVSTDERAYSIGSRVTMEGRYTAGPGLEGNWSPMSNEVFLPGSLP